APTREALRTILPDASKKDIEKYVQQLNDIEDFDPVLVISPDHNWIHQHSFQNYQTVMNAFATDSLQPSRRRDKSSFCVFHFSDMTELYDVRENIRTLYPHAFFNSHAQPPQPPIGTAWILVKIGVQKSDYGKDAAFFVTI